jgi:hypothetical protein
MGKSDPLLCPDCGDKLIALFTSAVCERCHPAQKDKLPYQWWEDLTTSIVEHVEIPGMYSFFGNLVPESPEKYYETATVVVLFNRSDEPRVHDVYAMKPDLENAGNQILRVPLVCVRELSKKCFERNSTWAGQFFYNCPAQFKQVAFLAPPVSFF